MKLASTRWPVVAAVAGLALGGCDSTSSPNGTAPAPPAPAAQYGTFGFDETGMDKAVPPGEDFYRYANGTWAANTPVPADKSNYGMFTALDDLSRERVRAILDDAIEDAGSKIGNAYASFLDEATVEAKGLTPLQSWLDEIAALQSKAD